MGMHALTHTPLTRPHPTTPPYLTTMPYAQFGISPTLGRRTLYPSETLHTTGRPPTRAAPSAWQIPPKPNPTTHDASATTPTKHDRPERQPPRMTIPQPKHMSESPPRGNGRPTTHSRTLIHPQSPPHTWRAQLRPLPTTRRGTITPRTLCGPNPDRTHSRHQPTASTRQRARRQSHTHSTPPTTATHNRNPHSNLPQQRDQATHNHLGLNHRPAFPPDRARSTKALNAHTIPSSSTPTHSRHSPHLQTSNSRTHPSSLLHPHQPPNVDEMGVSSIWP